MRPFALFQRPKPIRLSLAQRRLLRHVSRSFDLSIRLLPGPLQAPVAIGYLLARATDTVADTTGLPLHDRQHLLTQLSQAIGQPQHDAAPHQDLGPLTQAFAAQQTNPHERTLMQALPQCLPLLHTLGQDDQASVRQVLRHITQGQQLDMARFGPGLHALNTESELVDYTYLVAGCVGEFWTELSARHLPGYTHLAHDDMMQLGRRYGMGLQRLNILRDAGADLAAGRCYWPADTLATVGLSPALLAQAAHATAHANTPSATLSALAPLYDQWLDHTHALLSDGMRYALALKPLRLRLASALPALIGIRTVALMRQSGPSALRQRVKMPRYEVHLLLWRITLGLGRPSALARLFQKLSGTDTA